MDRRARNNDFEFPASEILFAVEGRIRSCGTDLRNFRSPQLPLHGWNMIFVGIVGFVFVTLAVTALIIKGNGDSPSNYF